jgi:hypothetical protein
VLLPRIAPGALWERAAPVMGAFGLDQAARPGLVVGDHRKRVLSPEPLAVAQIRSTQLGSTKLAASGSSSSASFYRVVGVTSGLAVYPSFSTAGCLKRALRVRTQYCRLSTPSEHP